MTDEPKEVVEEKEFTPQITSFLQVRMITAEAMTRGAYNEMRGWQIPEDEDPADEGYAIADEFTQMNWLPKAVFERSALGLENPTKITEDTLKRFLHGSAAGHFTMNDQRTTMAQVNPPTGFNQFAFSSCVHKDNYSEDIGKEICFRKIESEFYKCLGFVLSWGINGLNPK